MGLGLGLGLGCGFGFGLDEHEVRRGEEAPRHAAPCAPVGADVHDSRGPKAQRLEQLEPSAPRRGLALERGRSTRGAPIAHLARHGAQHRTACAVAHLSRCVPGARRRNELLRLARAVPRAILEAVRVRDELALLAAHAAGQAAPAARRRPAALCVEPRALFALAIDRVAAMAGEPAVADRCGSAAGRRHGHGWRWRRWRRSWR